MFILPDLHAYTYVNGHANPDEYTSLHFGLPDFEANQNPHSSGATWSEPDSHTYPDSRARRDESLYARAAFEPNAMAHAYGYANADAHTCHHRNPRRVEPDDALVIARRR